MPAEFQQIVMKAKHIINRRFNCWGVKIHKVEQQNDGTIQVTGTVGTDEREWNLTVAEKEIETIFSGRQHLIQITGFGDEFNIDYRVAREKPHALAKALVASFLIKSLFEIIPEKSISTYFLTPQIHRRDYDVGAEVRMLTQGHYFSSHPTLTGRLEVNDRGHSIFVVAYPKGRHTRAITKKLVVEGDIFSTYDRLKELIGKVAVWSYL